MTKEEIISAIKQAAEELGHVPSLSELLEARKFTRHEMVKEFGIYKAALAACGLDRTGTGYEISFEGLSRTGRK